MKRLTVLGVLVLTMTIPASSALAGYSTVGPPPGSEATHVQILEDIYGGTFVGSGSDLGSGLWSVFDNGTVTVTRVDDFGKSALLNMLTGFPGYPDSGDDDLWTDGTATATAEARFAGNTQEFGYFDADLGYMKLFDVTGSGFSASGSIVLSFSTGAIWQWARADDSSGGLDNPHYSEETSNSDGLDHLVTYHVTGVPEVPTTTNVWVLFWEDVSGTGSDRDFNDLVIEIRASDCIEDVECDDGEYCNGVEVCVDGVCGPGTPVDCGDGVDCTIDTCNETTDTCTHAPNDAACNDGQYCNGVETCDEVDDCQPGTPVDCGDGIDCTDDACDEASDTCTHTPDHGDCSDGEYCNGEEICDPAAGCIDGPDPSCGDGVGCTIDACDEVNDTCTHTPDDSGCDDDLYCTGVETCHLTDDCQSGTPVDCDDGVSCTIDACNEANDTCINTPDDSLCDDGLYCTGVETCHATDDCQSGTTVDCDDGIDCTDDSCDEDADVCVNAPNDALCNDGNPCTDDACVPGVGCTFIPDDSNNCSDGLFCNGLELCVSGVCQPGTDPCDDGVNCTVDSCDEANDSCTNMPDNGYCDDGLYCTGVETCDPLNGCQDGTPVDCSHLDDQCNEGICDDDVDACVKQPANEGQPCDDGLYCTVGETCTAGQCNGGAPRDCGDGVGCTVDTCNEDIDECVNTPDDTLCDNGEFCDGQEFCDPVLDCQNGPEPCHPDLKCDEVLDRCVICLGDEWCDDGLYCNGVETCDLVDGVCVPGTPVDCDDGVDCTIDACDEDADTCTHTPDDSFCSDGLYCTGVETCDPVFDCQPGTPVDCDDQVSCTVDVCNDDIDACTNTPDDALCDDHLYCTGVETCDPDDDCQPGTPIDCSHLDDQCNLGVCDDDLDTCVKEPANENHPCDDGEYCTVGENCTAGQCSGGFPRDCGDGIDCTLDTCDDTANECVHTPQDWLCDDANPCTDDACDVMLGCVFTPDDTNICDDGLYCNGAEACVGGVCQQGADPCDDAIDCTDDVCNEDTDTCTNVPDNAFCSDGQYCNGQEICDPQQGCIDGPAPNCNDGVPCTIDDCNEIGDICTHTADHGACDDNLYCNGAEICDLQAGCVDGPAPDCDDAIDCTSDACNENTDTCDHTPNDGACSDGQYCNGVEICEVGQGCVNGPAPDCSDGIDCTVDECIEASDSCSHVSDHHLCDDGDECTVDFCAESGCQYFDRCGACCLEDDTCTGDVGRVACENAHGVFHGLGTSCAGDSDGDGRDDGCVAAAGIPTLSTWGGLVLILLLLTGGKIYFGRRSLATVNERG